MQVFKTTTADLERQEIDSRDMVNMEVKIGNRVFQLSERDGALRVSVEGQLVAMPGGANMLVLSAI